MLMLAPSLLFAQLIELSEFPKRLQLYPRNSQDSGTVVISGLVLEAGHTSASVKVRRNSAPLVHVSVPLVYMGDSASFSFSVKIHSELSLYKFELLVDSLVSATADSVVSGDAYIMDGQSNSVGSGNWYYTSPWIRSFGDNYNWSANPDSALRADTVWSIATTCLKNQIGSIAMSLAKNIIEKDSIPICIINGGVSATVIESHLPSTNPTSIYQRLYYRVIHADLKDNIIGAFWHQGESDTWSASGYRIKFCQIYDAWMGDYPGIQKVYVFQIRTITCGGAQQQILREQQRIIPEARPNISLMTGTLDLGSDGCHYNSEGYRTMGNWLYGLVARDYYHSVDTVYITPPNIREAFFSNIGKTVLTLQFDQPVIPSDTGMCRYFSLDNVWDVADSIQSDSSTYCLTLYLKSPSNATRISYIPNSTYSTTGTLYNGPWLRNPRGIGALTFYDFPITSGATIVKQKKTIPESGLTASPNPFNPYVLLTLPDRDVDIRGDFSLKIFNAAGRMVADLSRAVKEGSAIWHSQGQPSGIYVARISSGSHHWRRTIVLIK